MSRLEMKCAQLTATKERQTVRCGSVCASGRALHAIDWLQTSGVALSTRGGSACSELLATLHSHFTAMACQLLLLSTDPS